MDATDTLCVVGTADRLVHLFDLDTNPLKPERSYESPLKWQTRVISCYPPGAMTGDARGFAIGSIEGRVGVQTLGDRVAPDDKKSFSFKCHRVDMPDPKLPGVSGSQNVYAVNDICFHRQQGTFMTCGADGSFTSWDSEARTKLKCKSHSSVHLTASFRGQRYWQRRRRWSTAHAHRVHVLQQEQRSVGLRAVVRLVKGTQRGASRVSKGYSDHVARGQAGRGDEKEEVVAKHVYWRPLRSLLLCGWRSSRSDTVQPLHSDAYQRSLESRALKVYATLEPSEDDIHAAPNKDLCAHILHQTRISPITTVQLSSRPLYQWTWRPLPYLYERSTCRSSTASQQPRPPPSRAPRLIHPLK